MMDREAVVQEALSWVGTRYVLGGMVKGAGCDCATLIYCIWKECGVVGHEDIGMFRGDWYMHASQELYMIKLLRHARKIAEGLSFRSLKPLPGNVVLVRIAGSKIYNHGGVVTKWPKIVHALPDRPVREDDATTHYLWARRPVAIFDPWLKEEQHGTA